MQKKFLEKVWFNQRSKIDKSLCKNIWIRYSQECAGTTRERQQLSFSAVSAAGTITVSGINVALAAGDSAATVASKVKEALAWKLQKLDLQLLILKISTISVFVAENPVDECTLCD